MVTIDLIKRTCESPQGFQLKTIIEFLIEIGTESLDPSKENIGGGWSAWGPSGTTHVARRVYLGHKQGMEAFHVKDPVTNKFVPDPRVIMIGRYLYQIGGLELMQRTYNGVTQLGFKGTTRYLSYAWNGLGEWRD